MIAMVTGASSGFGEAISRQLVNAGYRVIGTGRRAERLAAGKPAKSIVRLEARQEGDHIVLEHGFLGVDRGDVDPRVRRPPVP